MAKAAGGSRRILLHDYNDTFIVRRSLPIAGRSEYELDTAKNFFGLPVSLYRAPTAEEHLSVLSFPISARASTWSLSSNTYIEILAKLDGSIPFRRMGDAYGLNTWQLVSLERLFEILADRCVVEDLRVVAPRNRSIPACEDVHRLLCPVSRCRSRCGRLACSS